MIIMTQNRKRSLLFFFLPIILFILLFGAFGILGTIYWAPLSIDEPPPVFVLATGFAAALSMLGVIVSIPYSIYLFIF